MVGFAAKYQKDAGIGTIVSLMLPYTVVLPVVWTALLVVWYRWACRSARETFENKGKVMSDLDRVLDRIDADMHAALERLFATLRLKSISTDPAYAAETRACAAWHAADLAEIGFEAGVRDIAGHPMVVGHQRDGAGPSVLFYGHYDVQPVDPLELWETIPSTPGSSRARTGRSCWWGAGRRTTRAS